ncbi:WhiB family transcriptional regulator [Streptomyces cinereoruber]|uniref:WhiB family transcriptional regulator n=1 Tax=Streptomyces cinereoruber TaxID=67260 RepID=UPI0036317C4E
MSEYISEKISPISDPKEWVEAACAKPGIDPNIFFDRDSERSNQGKSNLSAKRICNRCAVRQECLSLAISSREGYGIWGGLTTVERINVSNTVPTRTSNATRKYLEKTADLKG